MSRVCQQCIHVKDLRIKLPLISFERTGAGKPRPTTFQTRRKKRRKIETLRLNPNVLIFLLFADLLSKTKSVQTHCALQGRTRFDDIVQMWISTIFKFKHLLTLILKKKSWSSVRAPCCSQSVLDCNPPSPLMLTLSASLVEWLKHEFTLSILQRSSHSSCPDIWIQPSSDFTHHPKL